MTDSIAINIKDVQFSYQGSQNNKIIDIASWQIDRGVSVFLSGPSGSGKSTIVQLIERFYDLEEGEILFLEDQINKKDGNIRILEDKIKSVTRNLDEIKDMAEDRASSDASKIKDLQMQLNNLKVRFQGR